MKTLKSFSLLALATVLALAVYGKHEETAPTRKLTIEQTVYKLEALENCSVTLSFTALEDWTITVTDEGADWLTAASANGTAGEQTVKLIAQTNLEEAERTAHADIVCGEQTVQVTVTQMGSAADVDFTGLFDPAFAEILQQKGYLSDAGKIARQDMEKIAAVTELDLSGSDDVPGSLTSLQGIEYFDSLTNLDCIYNQLTTLDVSSCPALVFLDCHGNQLTSLSISGCTALEYVDCSDNQLVALDFSGYTALTDLFCNENLLTSLNISGCTALECFDCSDNRLTLLDVSRSTALEDFTCSNNQLSSLDVSRCTELQSLECSGTLLTELDVSRNTKLETLDCVESRLTSLNISGCTALKYFNCSHNQLKELNVNDCTLLKSLWCRGNQLIMLNVSRCSVLETLVCDFNDLTSLNFHNCTVLEFLRCNNNQLATLDIRRNTALTSLDCGDNPGDGISTFPITAWFDNGTVPTSLYVYRSDWTYNDKEITIDFRKSE